jgi:hypothetical protein
LLYKQSFGEKATLNRTFDELTTKEQQIRLERMKKLA